MEAAEHARNALASVAVLLALGLVAGAVADRLRVPDIVLYLLAGVLAGPSVFHLAEVPVGSELQQITLIFGASYILFHGGLGLNLRVLRSVWPTLLGLATVTVVITASITGLVAMVVLGLPPLVAALLGAVIASTDPATLVPVFQAVRIRERVAQLAIAESAFNDATGSILAITLAATLMTGEFSAIGALGQFTLLAGGGMLVGALVGVVAAVLVTHRRVGVFSSRAAIVTVVSVIGAYAGAEVLHASGFMAVFVLGAILGNAHALPVEGTGPAAEEMHHFVEALSLAVRVLIFTILGTEVRFDLVSHYLVGGLVITAVFIFIARPASIVLPIWLDRRARWERNEVLFLAWVRETGVIPAALAGLLLGLGVPGAEVIASVTFLAIMATILVQASTTRWWAARLGLLEEAPHPN